MSRAPLPLALLVLTAFAPSAASPSAQTPPAQSPPAQTPLAQTAPLVETLPGADPAVVARFVEHMRGNMGLGRYPDGTQMRQEPPEERAKPILTPALAQIIFERGQLSGHIEVCGGDWEIMSFNPLMADLKARGDLNPKQLGFAALLHGAAQEQGRNLVEEDCTPGFKASLSATLALSKSISQKFSKPG